MSDEGITERRLIERIRRGISHSSRVPVGIGDDAAVLTLSPGQFLLATTDLLIEEIDFRRPSALPYDIGWKAMAVNLSDIAAMGGTPRYALSALALPEKFSVEEVDALYDGMKALAGLHGVELVGGDTSASPDGMVITLTLLGEAARPILRSGAQPGDLLMVTGSLGLSAAGLALLEQSLLGVSSEDEALVLNAHRRPTPRIREGQWLAREGTVHAMIDLSDGLATDLRHIANESKVSAVVRTDRLPIPAAVGRLAALARQDVLTFAVTGGEDFELLIAVAPGSEAELRRRFADETGTAITVIGEVAAGPPTVEFLDGSGQRVELGEGYDHFANRPGRERR